jgi:hypothetical protein
MMNATEHDRPREIKNPVNRPGIVGALLIFLVGLYFGFSSPFPLASILGYSMGTLTLVVIGYAYLKYTPRTVAIRDPGVSFRYVLGREVLVPWSEIELVVANPGDPDSWFGRLERVGYLRSSKGINYPMTYEVAFEIREAYRELRGTYPPGESQNVWMKKGN